jgi:pSer/pThr/pTyr-binding forkhead associated (FHA) protein
MSATTAFLATNDGALVYELEDADTTLGRAETNDIVLTNSRSISGNHCRVSVRAGRARLTDLGSMNGTFLNDARLQNSCVRWRAV